MPEDLTRSGGEEAEERAAKGGFAAATLAHDAEGLAGGQGETDVMDDGDDARAGEERAGGGVAGGEGAGLEEGGCHGVVPGAGWVRSLLCIFRAEILAGRSRRGARPPPWQGVRGAAATRSNQSRAQGTWIVMR